MSAAVLWPPIASCVTSVAARAVRRSENSDVAVDEGEAPEAIPYARWEPAHSERTAREHLAARHAELQTHVVHALHRPDGPSRVDQLARCILASPIPELTPQSHGYMSR